MNTTRQDSNKLFQKLHPLSLLAQLSSRSATGCLRVFTKSTYWFIYLESGKLTYATSSDKSFERLDSHLQRLNQQIPTLNSSARVQMRMMFENKNEEDSIFQADYQAICWLVDGDYITYSQAATLVSELSTEVLESFLTIREGSYEFISDNSSRDLPTPFCQMDLRSLVEKAQKRLKNRRINQPQVTTLEASSTLEKKNISSIEVKTNSDVEENLLQASSSETIKDKKNTNISKSNKQRLYTVACIDDSLTILKSIKRFLDEDNFSVVMINDPVKALMQILRSKPDLILLDVEMPNLDGYELCSLLRRHSAFKNIPIVMVTGRTGIIDRAKAKMVRASGYLAKPFTQSELLKVVFKYIN